jgi:hypothetical protein
MELKDLWPAVPRIREVPTEGVASRAATYLRTYPDIIATGAAVGEPDQSRLHRVALMAYGWMPRILRIDPKYTSGAVQALRDAQVATIDNWAMVAIGNLVNCLNSVVGASKVLHFTNPQVFPIWDNRIESFRQGPKVSQYHMSQPENYVSYTREIHAIAQAREFQAFFSDVSEAFQARLKGPWNSSVSGDEGARDRSRGV